MVALTDTNQADHTGSNIKSSYIREISSRKANSDDCPITWRKAVVALFCLVLPASLVEQQPEIFELSEKKTELKKVG